MTKLQSWMVMLPMAALVSAASVFSPLAVPPGTVGMYLILVWLQNNRGLKL